MRQDFHHTLTHKTQHQLEPQTGAKAWHKQILSTYLSKEKTTRPSFHLLLFDEPRLGVSVENVVATIDTPSSHQGILPLAKKKDRASLPAFFAPNIPITSEKRK